MSAFVDSSVWFAAAAKRDAQMGAPNRSSRASTSTLPPTCC